MWITHQGPAKMFCTLHPEPSCYLMGCDCNVYMHGECGHFKVGHSLGLNRSALDQQEDPGVVSVSTEGSPCGSSSWVSSSHSRGLGSIPTAGSRGNQTFGIHICFDILLKALVYEKTWKIKDHFLLRCLCANTSSLIFNKN